MASQKKEKTDERKELESVAKKLGVKSIHLFSKEGSLEAAIVKKQSEAVASEPKLEVDKVTEEVAEEVAQTEVVVKASPKRKLPPRMNVAGIGRDDRAALIERLEREDPECKYIFQSSNITQRELAAKGFEKTDYSLKNDVVCRTIKDSYEEMLEVRNEGSYEAMGRIDGGTGIVGKFDANPKSPKLANI
jgi:hypothetical protein